MWCDLENIRIYYEEYGSGRPIIMLHGYGIDHHIMTGCMEPVLKQKDGWRRIYIDMPGTQNTKGKDWIMNADQILQILEAFINKIIPDTNFSVIGESYGGYIARGLIYKMQRLIDGLLLICPCIIANKDSRELPHLSVIVNNDQLISHIKEQNKKDGEAFKQVTVVQDKNVWERFKNEILVGMHNVDEAYLEKFQKIGYGFSFDVDDLKDKFEKPALILTGRQDSMVGYKDAWKILDNYPRGTFAVLDKAGHNLQIEQASVFNSLVEEWLDRITTI
jgi:pimeloyl-ACP methyl ester carboxylesterase